MEVSTANEIDVRARRLAYWSFSLGLGGMLLAIAGLGVLLALAGIVCGVVALARLRAWAPHDGHGFALSGIILGIAALLAFPLLLATAVPRLIAMRDEQRYRTCLANLELIEQAKETWAKANHATNGTAVIAERLFANGDAPKCPAGGRYRLNAIGVRPQCSITWHNDSVN